MRRERFLSIVRADRASRLFWIWGFAVRRCEEVVVLRRLALLRPRVFPRLARPALAGGRLAAHDPGDAARCAPTYS